MIEMDPDLKRRLHTVLVAQGTTMKDWFIDRAEQYLQDLNQPDLPGLYLTQTKNEGLRMVAESDGNYGEENKA